MQLVSRAGVDAHDYPGRQQALAEAIRLCAELLADDSSDADRTAKQLLGDLRIAVKPPPDSRGGGVRGATAPRLPLTLTASGLETCTECPRRYYYRSVLGIGDPRTPSSSLGSATRRAVKRLHTNRPAATADAKDELLALFAEEAAGIEFVSRKEREQALERGREVLTQYLCEEAARASEIQRIEIDKAFSFRLTEDVALGGQWDRLDELTDGRVRIVIYRSSALDSRPGYLRGFRVPLYALAAREVTRRPLAAVEVINLRELKENKTQGVHIERQVLPWDDGSQYFLDEKRLIELRSEILAVAQTIRAGTFEPIPEEERCGQCGFRLLCDSAWGTDERVERSS